jgi:hypothetical protein
MGQSAVGDRAVVIHNLQLRKAVLWLDSQRRISPHRSLYTAPTGEYLDADDEERFSPNPGLMFGGESSSGELREECEGQCDLERNTDDLSDVPDDEAGSETCNSSEGPSGGPLPIAGLEEHLETPVVNRDVILGGTRGELSIKEKITLLESRGLEMCWYVDNSGPDTHGLIDKGQRGSSHTGFWVGDEP